MWVSVYIIVIAGDSMGDHVVYGVFSCSLAFHVNTVHRTLFSDFYIRDQKFLLDRDRGA